jgi:hypothetical protein
MRSKSLLRGLAKNIRERNTSKWKILLAENDNSKLISVKNSPIGGQNMLSETQDSLDDLFTAPVHRPAPAQTLPKLSPIIVDKPVDNPPKQATEALNVGNVSWTDICVQMNRMSDQFQHWSMRLYMNGLRGQTLELFAETPFFRDACQNRFGEDLLTACKKLNYPVKFVNITLRNK